MSSSVGVPELATELQYFEKHRAEFLRNAAGKYALVKSDHLVGMFEDEAAAVRHGYQTLGNVPFLVKQVTEIDIPLNFTSYNIGVWLPSFEIAASDLRRYGPVIQAFIGPSREHIVAFGAPSVAAPMPMSALVDTGAASTVITSEIGKLLGLRSVGVARIHTPTTFEPVLCRQFYVNVHFSEVFGIEDVLATEAPLTGQAVQCLIGRDILSRGVFTYSGVDSLFRLTF